MCTYYPVAMILYRVSPVLQKEILFIYSDWKQWLCCMLSLYAGEVQFVR